MKLLRQWTLWSNPQDEAARLRQVLSASGGKEARLGSKANVSELSKLVTFKRLKMLISLSQKASVLAWEVSAFPTRITNDAGSKTAPNLLLSLRWNVVSPYFCPRAGES